MATDLERLVVQLSADVRQFERQMARAQGVTNRQFQAIERRARQMNSNLDGIFARSFRGLAAPLAGVGAALGTREIARLADTWTDLTSRVNLAAGSVAAGGDVMERLGEVARRTYSSLEQTAEGYLLNATAMRELGYSTGQTLDYTEAVNNALVISGARGQRAASVMDALSKAMALGTLQGDNLNTVIQSGGRLAEALAAGLGVGVNQLRELGRQGQITGRDIVRSLGSQMEQLRREAEQMPATISDGFQLLQNALLEYVGNADQATGVSARISEALVIMADNFDQTADVALQLAGVIAGALVGRSLAGMITRLGLAGVALREFTRAMAAAGSMARLSLGMSGLAAAAGPVGLVIGGAVVSSLLLFSDRSDEASRGADRFAARLAALQNKAEESAEAVEAAGGRFNEALKNAISGEVGAAEQQFEDARAAALDLLDAALASAPALKLVRDEAGSLSRQPMASPEQIADLENVRRALADNAESADEAKQELYALANANPNFQRLADQMQPLLDYLALVAQGARQVRAEFAAISGSEASGAGPQSRGGAGNARRAVDLRREEGRAWEQEELRRARLGREQLALENEIARVKKEQADAGVRVSDEQIRRIAEARLAGNADRQAEGRTGRSTKDRADEYQRLAERIADATAAQVLETEVQRQINPLIDDYGYAVEKARTQLDLMNAAQKAGLDVTPALRQQIEVLAEQFAVASVEAAKLAEEQGRARQSAEEWMGVGRDVTRGFIDDLVEGRSAAESFAGALKKIGDRLINDVLDGIFQVKNAAGGGGGLFGFLGSLLGIGGGGSIGRADPWSGLRLAGGGTVRGPGGPTGDKIPAMLSDGEHVTRSAMAKKHAPLLAAINADKVPGFADGGFASRMPTIPTLRPVPSSSTKGIKVDVGVSVDNDGNLQAFVRGVSQQTAARVTAQGLQQFNRDVLPARVNQIARDPKARG